MVQLFSHIFTYYLIPLTFLWFLGWGKFKSRMDWSITAIMVSEYMLYILLSGRWDWVYYPIRLWWTVAWVAVLLYSFWKVRSLPDRKPLSPPRKFLYGVQLFISIFLTLFVVLSVKGQFYSGPTLRLSFPLHHGRYYVAQGGNSAILNYHHLAEPARFALDFTRLGPPQRRAETLVPAGLEQFYIYGDSVFAPCDGVVFRVETRAQDMPLGAIDTTYFVGNYIGIRHPEGYHVFLAHLKSGSIAVSERDTVQAGQYLARVGHTGVVDEPMLHLHVEQSDSLAILTGKGVAVVFEEGRFLRRNDVVERYVATR